MILNAFYFIPVYETVLHYTVNELSIISVSSTFTKRTHTCGELRTCHIGERVHLNGWVQYERFGAFIVLRDAYGLVQLVIPEDQVLIRFPSKKRKC